MEKETTTFTRKEAETFITKMIEVKIKKTNPNAVIPKYSHDGDAGLDLTAVSKEIDEDGNLVFDCGLAFEIPKGYVGLLFPRSSNAKKDLLLSNSVGVLDSNYRGSVMFKYKHTCNIIDQTRGDNKIHFNFSKESYYEIGDRIGQLIIIPYPHIEFLEVDELSQSERGDGGYGSTGK